MQDIRIAAVIFHSPLNQTRYNLDRTAGYVSAAQKKGASIVCFPELNISGYSPCREISQAVETIPGPISRQVLQMARDHQLVILAGMTETDGAGRIFASHLVAAPGGLTGIYRKIHIAPVERELLSPGDRVPLFDIQGVKVGIQLCYDAHFPELSTCMAAKGADVIFMPHASPRGTPSEKFHSWMRHLPARAFDNSLFVVACNQTGDNRKGLSFPGIALVIGPDGKTIKKNITGKEGLLVADLKAAALKSVRRHPMRYFLPNRRPEICHPEK